jgi:apolipoprotein N-acyltransferase
MRRYVLSLTGAAGTALLLAAALPPWKLTFFAPFALAPLLWALAHEMQGRPRFLTGWLAGLLYWLAVCHWIGDVLARYGGLNAPLAILAVVLFAAKGLHMAVFAWLAGMVLKRRWAIPAVAALWTGIERTHAPLGFAWLTLGNAGIEMDLPLRLAPLVGVYGLSFVFAAVGCGLALVLLRRDRRQLFWLLALVGLWAVPAVRLDKPPAVQAVTLQPNVPGDLQWTAEETQRFLDQSTTATLSEALDPAKPHPALLLWPEAPAPVYYYDDPQFRAEASSLARLAGAPFLFGGVAYTARREPLNSAVLLDGHGRLTGRYDKMYLVPFGEYIPSGFGWINKISSEAGDYAAGTRPGVLPVDHHALGVFICYESAFPHLVRSLAAGGADVLVNLTNDGYFGRGPARQQHVWLARMRAVENARWLLRSSNDGRTCSIDPAGRLWDEMPEFRRQAGRLRFAWQSGKTLYTRTGDWFAWGCLGLGLALVLWAQVPVYRPEPRP